MIENPRNKVVGAFFGSILFRNNHVQVLDNCLSNYRDLSGTTIVCSDTTLVNSGRADTSMPLGCGCVPNGFRIEEDSEYSMRNQEGELGNYSHFALLLTLTLLHTSTIELERGPSHRATPY